MDEVPITQQIFLKIIKNLREKYDIDEVIINYFEKLYQENKLSDTNQLDNFVKWLEEQDVKN